MTPSRRFGAGLVGVLALSALFLAAPSAHSEAPALTDVVRGLGAQDAEGVINAINEISARGAAQALRALQALDDDRLKVASNGAVFVVDPVSKALTDPLTGAPASAAGALRDAEMDNEVRRVIAPAIAKLKLGSPDPALRLEAAEELARSGDEQANTLMRTALAKETAPKVAAALTLALARADLQSPDAAVRLAAVTALAKHGGSAIKGELEALIKTKPDGTFTEPDARVRAGAQSALGSIRTRETLIAGVGHLLYGLSLGSVLLFAALGLAITFGVMGVINMAHGEMLTVGAYATYAVQMVFKRHFPGAVSLYLIAAVPVAFVVATALGVLLERTVIRWLYGRPLETLLATWGISLGLIQTIRLLFGASNVAVDNPSWLSGGIELFPDLVLSWNRIAVVLFVIAAALFVWFLLSRTSLGLQVRAVTQNRGMAACMGVRTSRVDMWTFGLGSGIAGLGGVAISQLGNVGPELGQSYILDSFMVVVLGGVGRIAGTMGAAVGLGVLQKVLEPLSGAVLGKIAVLVLIILFIQRRPQGLFPVKGRVEV